MSAIRNMIARKASLNMKHLPRRNGMRECIFAITHDMLACVQAARRWTFDTLRKLKCTDENPFDGNMEAIAAHVMTDGRSPLWNWR